MTGLVVERYCRLGCTTGSADKASPWIPPETSEPLYPHPAGLLVNVKIIARQTNTFKGFIITIPSLLDRMSWDDVIIHYRNYVK
jgi:hypothetical protein